MANKTSALRHFYLMLLKKRASFKNLLNGPLWTRVVLEVARPHRPLSGLLRPGSLCPGWGHTHGLVVERINMELYGGMGLGPSSPGSSSSSFFTSSFFGSGSGLAFLFTVGTRTNTGLPPQFPTSLWAPFHSPEQPRSRLIKCVLCARHPVMLLNPHITL